MDDDSAVIESADDGPNRRGDDRHDSDIIPRFPAQGYDRRFVSRRRDWLEARTSTRLSHVGNCSLETESMRGNVENPIGAAQVPLGVAGPLLVRGQHAAGVFYVPLATTEGALVRSFERGMVAITRAGGAVPRVVLDENRVSPVFKCEDVAAAHRLTMFMRDNLAKLKALAESTTRHGKLLRISFRQVGRDVVADFCFHTADAQGMNMISKATDTACRWIMHEFPAIKFFVLSGGSSEKRASGSVFAGGKGKYVTADARLSRRLTQRFLHVSPTQLRDMWQRTMIAQISSGALGYNGHYANGLTALFIACGQDVANVANSAVGITHFETLDGGDLYVSVTLPSLTIATVGGGTGLGTSDECLRMLGCQGEGKALKFAEIIAATVLAGELSFGAALASFDLVNAHETYGRNRPEK